MEEARKRDGKAGQTKSTRYQVGEANIRGLRRGSKKHP